MNQSCWSRFVLVAVVAGCHSNAPSTSAPNVIRDRADRERFVEQNVTVIGVQTRTKIPNEPWIPMPRRGSEQATFSSSTVFGSSVDAGGVVGVVTVEAPPQCASAPRRTTKRARCVMAENRLVPGNRGAAKDVRFGATNLP